MNDFKDDKYSNTNENLSSRMENNYENIKSKSQINAEYFHSLEQWVNDVRSYRYSCSLLCGFPYTMLGHQVNGLSFPQVENLNNFITPMPPLNQNFGMFTFHNQQQQQQSHPENGVEYTIPPLWKRFIAELVDFILLFVMKLAITLIAVDFFDFVDLDKYDLLQQQNKMDYKIAIEITSEILFLEIVHRLIVCLYEGIFLRKGVQNQIGGATPGKTFMGIRVILCSSIQQIEHRPNVVKVFPATDLGLGWSFARAFLKNLVLALLFPICFPFFFNKFNRTTYDILCHSIVVEDRGQPNRNR